VAKRTGKTHENLENELTTPPPVPRRAGSGEPARTRSSVGRQVRAERSGPIGISGGDFATPTARKRTTTQPRGVPVVGAAPTNGTPPPTREGAQPESPFGVPPTNELGDAASQLAAEAAAVRALDSGPLTPPPEVHDPGPTPPPESVSQGEAAPVDEAASAPSPENAAAEATASVAEQDAAADAAFHVEEVEEPPADSVAPSTDSAAPPTVEDVPLPEAAMSSSDAEAPQADDARVEPPVASTLAESLQALTGGGDFDAGTSEDHFSAQETPWPELSQQGAGMRAPTPVPGAIPTDAMGGDSGGARASAAVEPAEPSPAEEQARDDADVAAGDDLELDEAADGAEALDALPAEALADGGPGPSRAPEAVPPAPPPTPRVAAAPPPIPAGSPRRKTGEMRAPEVPAAQVVASIVPAIPAGAASLPEALAQRPRRPKRSKPWFEEVFDEDYLRTLPFMSADQTLREVEFIESSLAVKPGAQVLDIGCGYGRHAIELVQRGLDVTGLDLSLPLLLRAADEAQRRAMSVNFVHADMREIAFEKQFDGAYCMLTSFGYFDEDTNLRVAEGIARSLKPGGRFLLDIVNRDYVVSDLPSRVWWEGNGCVVLEEVDFNFHTSRVLTHRSIVFEDGRQLEQEISVRAYSLHEIGRLLRQAGFRVLDISGSLATRGHFFGVTSRHLLILAEKRPEEG
jgi:SAM-dependent methyltransferase